MSVRGCPLPQASSCQQEKNGNHVGYVETKTPQSSDTMGFQCIS